MKLCEMCCSQSNVSNMKGLKLQYLGPQRSFTTVGHNFVNFFHHSHQGPILISSFDRVWRLAGAADEENDKIWRRRAPPRFKKERLKD